MLFEPRESINPRAFAVRHALLEELQRRQAAARDAAERHRLERLARTLEVGYDATSRCYVVQVGPDAPIELPLGAFRFYEAREQADRRDTILDANRAEAQRVITALLLVPSDDRRAEATLAPAGAGTVRRVVVTGATGFIATRLIERLVEEGIGGEPVQVVAIARRARPVSMSDAVEWRTLDLATATASELEAACGRGAVVFHLAASASVGGGEPAYRNNVACTERLLDALRTASPARLVYASSIGAVDRAPNDPCTAPLDERSPPHPLTRYGESKLAGERLVAASGLPFAIVRPTWVYGPGMRANSHVSTLLAMVRRGNPMARIAFPGRVSLIHVDDLCSALLIAAEHPAAAGQTFFAADGDPVALGELFRELGDITGRPAGRIRVPGAVAAAARAVRRYLPLAVQGLHSHVLVADVTALRALGFTPTVHRRTGLIALARSTSPHGGRWIVTGAAGGIGRALARQLHAGGHRIYAADFDAAGLESLAIECPGTAMIPCDLATEPGRQRLALAIAAAPLDGLVNCAGIGARGTAFSMSPGLLERLLMVNVTALVDASLHALRCMAGQPSGGMLVNIASSAALQPLPGMAAYGASKAFVLSFSEALAVEMADTPVRVITICPGGTDTGFQQAAGVKRAPGERLMPAADAAALIFTAIGRGASATIFLGSRVHLMALFARVLPRRALAALWGRLMQLTR